MRYVVTFEDYGKEDKLLGVADSMSDAMRFVEQKEGATDLDWELYDGDSNKLLCGFGDAGYVITQAIDISREIM